MSHMGGDGYSEENFSKVVWVLPTCKGLGTEFAFWKYALSPLNTPTLQQTGSHPVNLLACVTLPAVV